MKLWPVCAIALGLAPVTAFAADPNLFDVWSFDRRADGVITGDHELPGRLWAPSGPVPEGGYTLVTVFHGFGERGQVAGLNTAQVTANIDNLFAAAQSRGFILYAPQSWNGWDANHGNDYAMAAAQMAKIMRQYDVDPTQVYITGLSNGGRGTWEMATVYDDVFAAAVPICGQMHNFWNSSIADPDVLADMPIWAVHARNDGTVDVAATRDGVNRIRAAKGLSPVAFPNKNSYPANYYPGGKNEYDDGLLRYTEYEFGNHSIWGTAYGRSAIYDWMLAHAKHNPQELQFGETLRFDLGENPITTDAQGNYWNSTTEDLSLTPGIVRAFAMTDEGRRTAITLDVSNTFQGDSTSQPPGLDPASSDAWFVQNFGGQDGLGEITLTGLTEGGLYDLELFGSSTNAGTVRYIINGIEKLLNFQNNLGNTVTFDDVVSADGTLTIQVRALGATYAYLNWFTITAVPEPTAIALLATGLLLLPRRRSLALPSVAASKTGAPTFDVRVER